MTATEYMINLLFLLKVLTVIVQSLYMDPPEEKSLGPNLIDGQGVQRNHWISPISKIGGEKSWGVSLTSFHPEIRISGWKHLDFGRSILSTYAKVPIRGPA